MTSLSASHFRRLPNIERESSEILSYISSSKNHLTREVEILYEHKSLWNYHHSIKSIDSTSKRNKIKKKKALYRRQPILIKKKSSVLPGLFQNKNIRSRNLSLFPCETEDNFHNRKPSSISKQTKFLLTAGNYKTNKEVEESIINKFTSEQKKLTKRLRELNKNASSLLNNMITESNEYSSHNLKKMEEGDKYLKYLNDKVNIQMDDYINFPIKRTRNDFYKVLDKVITKVGSLNPVTLEDMLNKLENKKRAKNKINSLNQIYKKNNQRAMRLIDLSQFKAKKIMDN